MYNKNTVAIINMVFTLLLFISLCEIYLIKIKIYDYFKLFQEKPIIISKNLSSE